MLGIMLGIKRTRSGQQMVSSAKKMIDKKNIHEHPYLVISAL
jgi:hypothetical protein